MKNKLQTISELSLPNMGKYWVESGKYFLNWTSSKQTKTKLQTLLVFCVSSLLVQR